MLLIQLNVEGQCTINDCPDAATLNSGTPYFNGNGITIPLVNFNNIYCPNGHSGLDVYLYQILPNGDRMENCNVFSATPDNIGGNVQLYFGAPDVCIDSLLVVDIEITEDDGFVICDGIKYEVVLALWVDDVNIGTLNLENDIPTTVYSAFPNGLNTNYIDYNAGIIEIDSNDDDIDFPYIVNEISLWNTTGNDNNIELQTCEDLELYVAGYSLLANCLPYDNFESGINSEIFNTLTYSINGSPSANLLVNNIGIGGPVTGNCYGGILSETPTIIPTSNFGLSEDDELIVTITTTDFFTAESKSSSITIEFEECEIECLAPNNINVGSVSDNAATISWSSPLTPDGFLVELRLKDSTTWQQYNTEVNFIIFSGLLSCEEYEFRISSTCDGQNYITEIKEFTTVGCPIPCQSIEGLFVNNPTSNSIVLAWDIYPNATYTLFYRMQNSATWLSDFSPFPLAILVTLAECTNWEWYVVVNCNDGTFSQPSVIQTFSTTGCFRDDTVERPLAFELYPNPATKHLMFNSLNDQTTWTNISISNSIGQILGYYNFNEISNNTINLPDLSTGVYFIQFLGNNKIESQRFTIE